MRAGAVRPLPAWHGVDDVEPGDVALVIADTESPTVRCAARQRRDQGLRLVIAEECWGSLPTVAEMEAAAGSRCPKPMGWR